MGRLQVHALLPGSHTEASLSLGLLPASGNQLRETGNTGNAHDAMRRRNYTRNANGSK